MIGKLTGMVDSVSLTTAIIDVGGVGYEVILGSRQLSALPPVGDLVTLSTDMHFREDGVRLYGFATEHERAWFRALQSVQGVGAKVALAVLGTLSVADLANAVSLVAELKDKMPALAPAIAMPGAAPSSVAELPEGLAARDAVSALTNLGYAHGEAAAAVSTAIGTAGRDAGAAELIRLGLRELAS